MSLAATPGLSGGTFGSGRGILAGRLGGNQIGIVAIGIDAGAGAMLRNLAVMSKVTEGNINRAGKSIIGFNVAASGMINSLAVMTAGIGIAAVVVKDFNTSIAEISSITGADTEEVMRSIGDTAIEMSQKWGFSAAKIADAGRIIAQAGFDLETTKSILVELTEFVRATPGAGFEDAAKFATEAFAVFNLTVEDSERLFNSLTFTINNAKVAIVDLRQGFNQLAPVASALGISLESTLATLGALGTAGLGGSAGGTGTKTGLLESLSPTGERLEKYGETLNAFKFAVSETGDFAVAFDLLLRGLDTNLVDFSQSLEKLRIDEQIESIEDISDVKLTEFGTKIDTVSKLTEIFGIRAVRAWLAYSTGAVKAKQDTIAMELQLEDTTDAANRAMEQMGAQAGRLGAQLAAALLQGDFGSNLTGMLQGLADSGAFVEIGEEINDGINDALLSLAENADSIAELMVTLSKSLSTFADSAVIAFDALSGVLKVLNSLGPVADLLVARMAIGALFGGAARRGVDQFRELTKSNAITRLNKQLQDNVKFAANSKLANMSLTATFNEELFSIQQLTRANTNRIASINLLNAQEKEQGILTKENFLARQTEIATLKKEIAHENLLSNAIREEMAAMKANSVQTTVNMRAHQSRTAALKAEILASEKAITANSALGASTAKTLSRGTMAAGGVAAGAAGKAALRGTAGRAAGAALGLSNPVGWLIMGLTIVLPLISSFSRKSREASDITSSWAEEIRNGAGAFNELDQSILGVNEAIEAQEKLGKSKLLSSTFVPGTDGSVDKLTDVYAVDLSGMSEENRERTMQLAIEQNKRIVTLGELLNSDLSDLDRQRYTEFRNAKLQEYEAQRQTEIGKVTLVQKTGNAVTDWFKTSFVNAMKITVGTIGGFLYTLGGNVVAFVSEALAAILRVFDKLPDWMTPSYLGDAIASLEDYAKQSRERVEGGIDAARDDFLDNVGGLNTFIDTIDSTIPTIDDFVIIIDENTSRLGQLADTITGFKDNIGDFESIFKRLDSAVYDTVDGVQVMNGTFFEIANTGFELSQAMSKFKTFLITKEMTTIAGEISGVFTSLGRDVPAGFQSIIDMLNTQLLGEATALANLFDPNTFNAESFIEILAKAMDSPRFEQNNNIVIRVSTSGNPQQAVEAADIVARRLTGQGIPVRDV